MKVTDTFPGVSFIVDDIVIEQHFFNAVGTVGPVSLHLFIGLVINLNDACLHYGLPGSQEAPLLDRHLHFDFVLHILSPVNLPPSGRSA